MNQFKERLRKTPLIGLYRRFILVARRIYGIWGSILWKTNPSLHARFSRAIIRGPYHGTLLNDLIELANRFGEGEEAECLIAEVRSLLQDYASKGEFDPYVDLTILESKIVNLSHCISYRLGRWWTLSLFYMRENESHPPHAHDNLASAMVVLRGKLGIRTYQRDRTSDTADYMWLTPKTESVMEPFSGTETTENLNNVHWFGSLSKYTVAINFNVVGYVNPSLIERPGKSARIYLDLTHSPPEESQFRAPVIGAVAAHDKYADRSINLR